jgi:hypothetical protein
MQMLTINNLKHRQAYLRIGIFSLVTVMIWVGYSIYHSQQQTVVSQDLQKHALPLNPNIDTTIVDRIENKKTYSEAELSNFTIYRRVQTSDGKDEIVTNTGEKISQPSPSTSPGTIAPPVFDTTGLSVPTSSPSASPVINQ